jgi:hypothetical protein
MPKKEPKFLLHDFCQANLAEGSIFPVRQRSRYFVSEKKTLNSWIVPLERLTAFRQKKWKRRQAHVQLEGIQV